MPTCSVSIPFDEPLMTATLHYLCEQAGDNECGGLMYLQGVRSRTLVAISPTGNPEDTAVARTYHGMRRQFVSQLIAQLHGPFAAIVSPPSRYPEHAEPYRLGVQERFPDALDLTHRFSRASEVSSGSNASFVDVCTALTYVPAGDEVDISSIIVVDDIFARGRTIAALVLKLRQSGFAVGAPITIACPLWVPRLTS
jgi:hypothetical protein